MESLPILDKIRSYFSLVDNDVHIDNRGYGFYNINKFSEDCLCRILEIVYSREFIVSEYKTVNEAAIDIESVDGEFAFQITSETTADKIKRTVIKHIQTGKNKKFRRLGIIFLSVKYDPNLSDEKIEKYIHDRYPELKDITLSSIGFSMSSSVYNFTKLVNLIKEKCRGADKLSRVLNILETEYNYLKTRTEVTYAEAFADLAQSLNPSLSRLTPIEAIHKIVTDFSPLAFLPRNLILGLYPFSLGKTGARINQFTLSIEDEEFADLLFDLIDKYKNQELDHNQTEVAKDITHFLRNNGINCIIYYRKNKSRFVPFIGDGEECDCVRCQYNRMRFDKAFLKVLNLDGFASLKVEEKLRHAFISVKLGLFEQANKIFSELSAFGYKQLDHVLHYVSEYNLRLLPKHLTITDDIDTDKQTKALSLKKKRTDILVYSSFGSDILLEKNRLLKWIEFEEYSLHSIELITEILAKARIDYRYSQYGSYPVWFRGYDLLGAFLQTTLVISGNFITSYENQSFRKVLNLSFEAFLYIHIEGPRSPNDVGYVDYFLRTWIEYCDPRDLKEILLYTDIPKVSRSFLSSREEICGFIVRFQNLVESVDTLNSIEITISPNSLRTKINKIAANTLILARTFELNSKESNYLIKLCVRLINKYHHVDGMFYSEFNRTFNSVYNTLTVDSIKLVLDQFFESENDLYQYLRTSQLKADPRFRRLFFSSYDEELNLIESNFSNSKSKGELNVLFDDYEHLNDSQRERFRKLLLQILKKDFTPILCYRGVIHGIIKFSAYKKLYLKKLKVGEGARFRVSAFGTDHQYDMLLELFYIEGLDLEEIRNYRPDSEYYSWLTNIQNFDYSDFDPSWVLRNQSTIFIKEYQENSQVKALVKQRVEEDYSPGLSRFYFKYLQGEDSSIKTERATWYMKILKWIRD
jgi:hypothetical protein